MRIGLVTGEFPPMEGGVGAFTEQLARAMSEFGHEIHVITSRLARPAGASRKPSELFEPLDLGYARLHARGNRWRWSELAMIATIIERFDLQVVNVQYQAAAYNMKAAGINFLPWRMKALTRTVVTFHDLRVPYLFPKAGRLREDAVHFMARHAAGVIATNGADGDALRDRTSAPLRVIPIGSNIDAHIPTPLELTEVRESLDLDEGDCLLGYFGFLNESKGADVLLDAMAALDPRYHLVFIGGQTGDSDRDNNADFLTSLKSRAEALGLSGRVHWTGFLSPARVSTYLVAADMLVMPYRDGASLRRGTLMAALAHGRPLITTTPASPTPELVDGENVHLISPGDAIALAKAIRRLASDGALRDTLGAGASELAGRFTWDQIAVQTLGFYTELLSPSVAEANSGRR